jgi:Tol biopolymer transport system component/DNA-binding winged helix-turn-helix (wHTH) protein
MRSRWRRNENDQETPKAGEEPLMAGKSLIFKFGDVEVREREFSLVKAGEVLPVEPKAFRVLLILLRNPGKLIPKEELLNAVWGDAAVTDNSLTRSVALLRRLLGDDSRNPRFIETVATVGYRLVCKVEVSEDHAGILEGADETNAFPADAEAQPPAETHEVASDKPKTGGLSDRSRSKFPNGLFFGAGVIAVGLAILIWFMHRPLPPPRIVAYTQITRDGHEKLLAGTDGSRIYFSEFQPNSLNQVGVAGGEVAQIPAALSGFFWMLDISPDGSNLLVTSSEIGSDENALWIVPVLGGTSRRIGNGWSATFSPDGNSIAYLTGSPGELWLAQSDGTGGHKLASIGGDPSDLRWSPDGKAMRFSNDGALWEISANGSHLHEVLPGWQDRGRECCGRWTPDGKFYIFLTQLTVFRGDKIWALDERRGLFRHPSAEPIQLTSGPTNWRDPIPGKGMNKIFSNGKTPRGELCRLDPKTKQLQPILGGISAQDVSFSKDGRSVAYVSYPDGILWKANKDGSNPVQLTTAPIYATNPRWSPDGTQIAFTGLQLQEPNRIYLVSSQGGSPQQLLQDRPGNQDEPGWSSDGRKILFQGPGLEGKGELFFLDLPSSQVTSIPGSAGFWSPRWSPDGKLLAAFSNQGLKVLDLASLRWSTLPVSEDMEYDAWSSDSKYIYFLRVVNGDRGVYRIRASGGKAERVADLKDWHITGYFTYWMALDPTDAPLLLRDVGNDDIYALTLEEK